MVLAAAYVAGAIPFAQITAHVTGRADLRRVGNGTVSASGLRGVTGVVPLLVTGVVDVGKGAVGPLLAGGRRRRGLAAVAAAVTVSGHNWSVFLRGAGGRGVSPAMGSLLVTAPEGTAVMLTGLAIGRIANQTALGSLISDAALIPVLYKTRGRAGVAAASAVVIPLLAKRLLGNGPAATRQTYVWRLLYDRDRRIA